MHEIITILFLARLRNVTSSRKTEIWANENIGERRGRPPVREQMDIQARSFKCDTPVRQFLALDRAGGI